MRSNNNLFEIQQSLRNGDETVTALVQKYLRRIEETSNLNIYVEVFADEAIEEAKALDQKIRSGVGKPGPLFGAVISIKDVLCYKDHEVTASSRILEGFRAQFTATAIQRLIDADAIIIGRTNCDEFAMGSTNENSVYGPTLNGLDENRVPGGSSGAAAVSVERDTCLIGIGSDTGGSVRQPAAFCGVYGFKPGYGRISRYGLIAYGSSFDQIGVLSKNVIDISIVLHIMSGSDSMDATCLDLPPTEIISPGATKKYKIAYIPEVLDHPGLNPVIRQGMADFIHELGNKGHVTEPISFDLLPFLVPAYYVLTTAEASSNLSRYDGIRYGHRTNNFESLEELYERSRSEGFGAEVKRRIIMGTFVLSVGYFDAYFTKAQQVRTLIIDRLKDIFSTYDFVILPTTTDVAWKSGEMSDDPVSMYLSDIYTVMANLGGYPAISIPRSHELLKLPFGIQIMSDKYQEHSLLSLSESLD